MALLQAVESNPHISTCWAGSAGEVFLFPDLFALCLYNLKGFCLPANLDILGSSLSRIIDCLDSVWIYRFY